MATQGQSNSLLDFWKQHADFGFHPLDADFIKPDCVIDWSLEEAQAKASWFEKNRSEHKKIHKNLLPVPFSGNIREAIIFILYGNPGLKIRDYKEEHTNAEYQKLRLRNLRGEVEGFPQFEDAAEKTDGGTYWRKALKRLITDLAEKTRWSETECQKILAKNLAVIEAGAYHSRSRPGSWVDELPSSLIAQGFAQQELYERANAGEILILVWRRCRFWALSESQNVLIRSAKQARIPSLLKKERDEVVNKILANEAGKPHAPADVLRS